MDHGHGLERIAGRVQRFPAACLPVEDDFPGQQLNEMTIETGLDIRLTSPKRIILQLSRQGQIELQILRVEIGRAQAAPQIEVAEEVTERLVKFVHQPN
jgi:hypothetical protein